MYRCTHTFALWAVWCCCLCGTVAALLPEALRAQTQAVPSQALPSPKKPFKQLTMALVGGLWFNGTDFAPATWYVVEGTFTATKPQSLDTTLNLGGMYIVPPFGEAHNHSAETPFTIDATTKMYLRHGIFYFKNPNSLPHWSSKIRHKVNIPQGLDVIYSGGGLTSNGGHPMPLYKQLLSYGIYPTWTVDSLNGQAYTIINDSADVEQKWAEILAKKPDFLKTYLLYADEYETRKHKPVTKGLNPVVLPFIVQRAHKAGLRVSAHIETASDFRTALASGVDEINHLPYNIDSGYASSAYMLTEQDAQHAAQRGLMVVPTAVVVNTVLEYQRSKDSARAVVLERELRRVQHHNITLLHKAGVRLLVGCDTYAETALSEALYLHKLGVFDNRTLLRMWCEATPKAIFPTRKIAAFREGYEASFLALTDNPLERFAEAVQNIAVRVKNGVLLHP